MKFLRYIRMKLPWWQKYVFVKYILNLNKLHIVITKAILVKVSTIILAEICYQNAILLDTFLGTIQCIKYGPGMGCLNDTVSVFNL